MSNNKSLREYINIVESFERTNEGEFGDSSRDSDAPSAWERNTIPQKAQRAALQGLRQIIPVGRYTDKYGTEGYDFQPDWNALGYAQYGDQHVQKINGEWIADDGMKATDPAIVKRLEQQALADIAKTKLQPRGGWKQDNPLHQQALNTTGVTPPPVAQAPAQAPAQPPQAASTTPAQAPQTAPSQPTTTPPAGTPAENTQGKSKSGKDIIFRNGRWEYL